MIENLQTGYVKIYRSWIASGIWSMPWAWERVAKCCILLANHKPNKYWDGKENIKVPSGTFITSDRTLAEAAKVTRKQARAALDALGPWAHRMSRRPPGCAPKCVNGSPEMKANYRRRIDGL